MDHYHCHARLISPSLWAPDTLTQPTHNAISNISRRNCDDSVCTGVIAHHRCYNMTSEAAFDDGAASQVRCATCPLPNLASNYPIQMRACAAKPAVDKRKMSDQAGRSGSEFRRWFCIARSCDSRVASRERVSGQLSSLIRKGKPPLGVNVTVAWMPAGFGPAYSGRNRRSSRERASVFSTWLMAPPMQERLPAPNGM